MSRNTSYLRNRSRKRRRRIKALVNKIGPMLPTVWEAGDVHIDLSGAIRPDDTIDNVAEAIKRTTKERLARFNLCAVPGHELKVGSDLVLRGRLMVQQ